MSPDQTSSREDLGRADYLAVGPALPCQYSRARNTHPAGKLRDRAQLCKLLTLLGGNYKNP
jgi:hypothetical protein